MCHISISGRFDLMTLNMYHMLRLIFTKFEVGQTIHS